VAGIGIKDHEHWSSVIGTLVPGDEPGLIIGERHERQAWIGSATPRFEDFRLCSSTCPTARVDQKLRKEVMMSASTVAAR
jgi:hypothetical protein